MPPWHRFPAWEFNIHVSLWSNYFNNNGEGGMRGTISRSDLLITRVMCATTGKRNREKEGHNAAGRYISLICVFWLVMHDA